MKTDPKKLNFQVRTDLIDGCEFTEEIIAGMSAEEIFEAYCNWNGLIRWSNTLTLALDSIRGAAEVTPEDLARAVDVLARYEIQIARDYLDVTGEEATTVRLMECVDAQLCDDHDYDDIVAERAAEILNPEEEITNG